MMLGPGAACLWQVFLHAPSLHSANHSPLVTASRQMLCNAAAVILVLIERLLPSMEMMPLLC